MQKEINNSLSKLKQNKQKEIQPPIDSIEFYLHVPRHW